MVAFYSEEREACAYPPCLCLADKGQLFCSEPCRKDATGERASAYVCLCGHSHCENPEPSE
jgi:hypothetical protein